MFQSGDQHFIDGRISPLSVSSSIKYAILPHQDQEVRLHLP